MSDFRRRSLIPGLPPDATKEIVAIQDGLLQGAKDLREQSVGGTTETKTASFTARLNFLHRILAPAAGLSVTFPAADSKVQNSWIELVLLAGSGPVTVRATSLQVDGAATAALTTAGRYAFRPDGLTSWWSVRAGGSGGGGAVTDGDYGDVIVSGAGTVWTLDDAAFLARVRRLLNYRAGP
jgi:hypothetical protein